MLKAKCSRLKGRCIVVGRTPFVFDTDGICRTAVNNHYVTSDFQLLLKMNGVKKYYDPEVLPEKVVEKQEEVAPVETPAPVVPEEPESLPPAPVVEEAAPEEIAPEEPVKVDLPDSEGIESEKPEDDSPKPGRRGRRRNKKS